MKSRGFTLIEILVSLAIFSVVAVIAIGALVRVTSANRQAQAIQSGVNNVSFIVDTISREMRVGTTYDCIHTGGDLSAQIIDPNSVGFKACPLFTNSSGDVIIAFDSSNVDPNSPSCNLIYAYLFHVGTATTTIYKAQQTSCNETIEGINNVTQGQAGFFPILSPNVNITDYSVGIFGGSGQQPFPWVFLRLKGYVGLRVQDQSVFDVQTSISQRTSP